MASLMVRGSVILGVQTCQTSRPIAAITDVTGKRELSAWAVAAPVRYFTN